ncbi:MAG: hypothetical protein PHG08_02940 [Bacilli bacterium]|nr:hypothetical protein [Bacilli bacterium]
MNIHILKFLYKSLLGRNTDLKNSEQLVMICIEKAYKDMLSGGRFFSLNKKAIVCSKMNNILKNNNYTFSREMIRDLQQSFDSDEMEITVNGRTKTASSFGLAQKIVNMTFKYLYCVHNLLDFKIDFTICDCPLDSIILKGINSNLKWTNISEKDYVKVQSLIDESLSQKKLDNELHELGRLAYDFINW